MRLQPEIEEASIVVVGDFNPAIFHPLWFANNDLIRAEEADAAETEIVHREVAAFSIDWLTINVTQGRFQAQTKQGAYYEPLRDLVLGVLDLLSHTPVRALGLNRHFHYPVKSEKDWHSIGNRLAPKKDWEDFLHYPGMRSLQMEGQRTDNYAGYVRIVVEPSGEVEPGIYVMVNDHYALHELDTRRVGTKTARRIVDANWTHAMSSSLQIASHIVNLGAQQ